MLADESTFAPMRAFFARLLDSDPAWEVEGFTAFRAPDGSSLELLAPVHVPEHGLNGGIAFGFFVDDIDEASAAVVDAGGVLLGDIVRTDTVAYRHFRGPDGRTYGFTQADGVGGRGEKVRDGESVVDEDRGEPIEAMVAMAVAWGVSAEVAFGDADADPPDRKRGAPNDQSPEGSG
ncbi:hypothetical protein [Nocardioides sp. NPDC006303]|uniref:VOC family protein n=1 Tax=Nocardioides sp. NPDC006303 TaxID=3156747 RepID=UPI0033A3F7C3